MSDFLVYMPMDFCFAGQVHYHNEARQVWSGTITGSKLLKDYGELKLCAVKRYKGKGPLYVFVDNENYEKLKEASERLTDPIKKERVAESLESMDSIYRWDTVRMGNIDHIVKTLASFGFHALRRKVEAHAD